jgi:hypothetical protein
MEYIIVAGQGVATAITDTPCVVIGDFERTDTATATEPLLPHAGECAASWRHTPGPGGLIHPLHVDQTNPAPEPGR